MGTLQKPQLLISGYFICISVMTADCHYIIPLLLLLTAGSCQAIRKIKELQEKKKGKGKKSPKQVVRQQVILQFMAKLPSFGFSRTLTAVWHPQK